MPERNDTQSIDSIPGICEITRHGDFGSGPGFLIELPHGATRGAHFEALRGRLRDDYPDDLEQFFFVNTDVGGPECADEIARRLAQRGHGVLVVRCLLPRTFVDCNRIVGNGLRGDEMTPPVPWFVKDEVDIALLLGGRKPGSRFIAPSMAEYVNPAARNRHPAGPLWTANR